MSPLTRREFLGRSLLACVYAQTAGLAGCAGGRSHLADPANPRRFFADLHAHPSLDPWVSRSYAGRVQPTATDIAKAAFNKTGIDWHDCHKAGIEMMCAAHFNLFDEWLSMPTDPNPDAPRQTLRMLDTLEADLKTKYSAYAKLAHNHLELDEILGEPGSRHPIAVVHTLEGGHALGQDLLALDRFAARGVASITITHFFNKGIAPAANAFPFFPDSGERYLPVGLSEFGFQVVHRMEELGMIVDLSHAPAATVDDLLSVTERPMVASHSSARALGDHAYSIHDRHIRELVAKGGLFGIILMPYWLSNYTDTHQAETHGGVDDVVRTARHLANVTGTHRGIAIGSDFGGFIPRLKEMNRLSQIHRLQDGLARDFSDDQVEAIMAGNTIEFYRANWRTGLS